MQAPHQSSSIDPILPLHSTRENRNHDIKNFLGRAYAIANFTWAKTSPQGAVLATYRFPDILLSQPALAAKTRNFFGLRAGVELIVLVNKQQFQAGNLLISYLPNARYNPAKVAMALASLPTRTGMPRTNLDLMDATRATLAVPYASPFVYYNLLTNEGTIGDFQISVYSPLSDVADGGTVSVQVFARFVDIDLEFPTGSLPATFSKVPALDSMIENFRTKTDLASLTQMVNEGKQILQSIQENRFRFQMNSENVVTQNFKPRALPNMAVSSDTNNSHIMSLSSSNMLPSTNMGQTATNETNFNSVLQIPCYHDTFQISNQASGVNVWSKLVQPQVPLTPNADGSINPDYIYYHSEPFSKWRGSFKYHFRFVKTTFHSLRIRVWFSPASVISDTIDRNAVYSKIIDLKDTNQFMFEVPYIWPHPFLNVHSQPMSLGTIGIDIINQMVFPTTVDSTINVIVERSAGTDFCLNLPTVISKFPFDPTVQPTRRTVPQTTGTHHIARRTGVQLPLPDVANVSYDVAGNGPPASVAAIVSADRLSTYTHLSSAVRDYYNKNQTQIIPEKISLLNDLSDLETVDLRFVNLSLQDIRNRIKSHFDNMPHTELRRKRFASASNQWVRDLTREGVEPNPGPVYAYSSALTSAISSATVTISHANLTSITINVKGDLLLARKAFAMSGLITGNLVVTQNGIIQFSLPINSGATSITFTTVTALGGTEVILFDILVSDEAQPVVINDQPISVSTQEPLVVNVTPNPLPVTISDQPIAVTGGGGGASAIVATTSITPPDAAFHFQMNAEQDQLRTGADDATFERPVSSVRADQLAMGQKVADVKDMIKRSSLVATATTPSNAANIFTVLPHMFGCIQKDDDGLVLQNACDLLSYYASSYAFARGGINLRVVSAPDFYYNVILDPDNIFSPIATTQGFVFQNPAPPTAAQTFQLNNPLQQVVKPSLEGFGEFSIPFYSDTFMYSINLVQADEAATSNRTLQLPYTQLAIQPNGAFEQFKIFRAACSDFEYSYLTGPPVMYPIS